jgi:hypothetical protein
MNLQEMLENERDLIIEEATKLLSETPLKHYQESSMEENLDRITKLYDLTCSCIESQNLIPMMDYAAKIGTERYHQFFNLEEVHMAFNVLEEVIWTKIPDYIEPNDFPNAYRLVSTVLGYGKESLATTYLALVSNRERAKNLDYKALFGR